MSWEFHKNKAHYQLRTGNVLRVANPGSQLEQGISGTCHIGEELSGKAGA